MDNANLSPANIAIMGAGFVMLLFSFLPFYDFGSDSWSSWSGELGIALFPIATLVVVFGLVMATHVALTTFANVDLPRRVLGLTWNQVHLALGFQSVVIMVAYFIRSKAPLGFGLGFWFMFPAAIGLLVGAMMRVKDTGV